MLQLSIEHDSRKFNVVGSRLRFNHAREAERLINNQRAKFQCETNYSQCYFEDQRAVVPVVDRARLLKVQRRKVVRDNHELEARRLIVN